MYIPTNVKQKMQKLLDGGFEAYIIGGAIRDIHRYKKPHDYDLFTNATGKQILNIFPKGKIIGNEKRQAKILTVIVDNIEISQYRTNGDRTKTGIDFKKHLSTCDFGINAIACDVNEEFYDYHNGIADIHDCIIKCVGNPIKRFDEDLSRIMRAIRFETILGFDIDEKTKEIMHEKIKNNELNNVPQDCIRDELLKMIKYPRCFMNLYHNFILSKYLPESDDANLQDGCDHHDEPVLAHCNYAFMKSLELTDNYRINIAAFLHDMGKPKKCQIDKDGKISFTDHQKESVIIAERFLKRLKFKNSDIKYITTMIAHHMMGDVRRLKDNTIIKYYNTLEDAGITIEDMLIMTYCDNQGNQAKPTVKFNEFYQQNNWLRRIHKLKYQRMPFRMNDLEINGHDIIKIGITDGKKIGEKLNKIFKKVQNGDIKNDRHTLMNYLKGEKK